MAGFYIYETKSLTIKINKEDVLKNTNKIIVSIYQKNANKKTQIDKTGNELGIDEDNSIINLYLTQEETAQFTKGIATVQVNIYYNDMERDTTVETMIDVYDNLYKKVIT